MLTASNPDYSYVGHNSKMKPGPVRRDLKRNLQDRMGASIKKITDGTSKTIAMGEASGDPKWKVCHGRRVRQGSRCTAQPVRANSIRPGSPGLPDNPTARNITGGKLGSLSSIFAATVEPMNKNPVTDSFIEVWQL